MKFGKKALAALLSLSLVLGAGLAGCAGKTETKEGGKQAEVQMAKEQVIKYNLGADPETLDPAKATGAPEMTVLNALFEGLTRYDKDGKIAPGMAEKWEISEDGTKYTFHLRDAKWSNGDPVTAKDFEYAWLRALDPKTASDYAYQLYYLKNGEEYNSGKITDPAQVGVKAIDDKTLEVTLKAPAPQFLGLTAFSTLYPVNKKAVEANPEAWFKKPETMITNGPFKMKEWTPKQQIVVEKNPGYWDANTVKLNQVVFTMVESADTELTMFKTGQIDIGNNPPTQEIENLKKDGSLKIGPQLTTYFYRFNVTRKPLDNPKVRKALALAIDREAIVKNVTKAGQTPADAFVPVGFPDATPDKDFRKVGGSLIKTFDAEEARKLLAEAGYPDGKGFPEITILYNTNENHQKIALAIQEMWKKNLGINVKLVNQEWKVYLKSQSNLDYDISRAGWGADYLDPMTFMDMFVTNGGNNNTGWSNARYDELIKKANLESDNAKRMEYMHEAEKILMDEMPIAPIYFYTHPYLMKDNLKDVVVPSFGPYFEFKWAWVAEK
ncbi:oligopeptide transport system substrate-binding protein [Carboxydocella sporoproducens DSM 16521]|uniref:Oligopeptide transport system substrate-binding protein n=2 Tax=Carboxydocella TaxID=178898 RepID=A0A1T4LA13_9FIRM|nr:MULTISPECIES: peptide ABC transporter substrate-binding protein [Carboxydocella]AVX19891.1 oligopeptide transport system substrate-binding protein [Carboxydocella thermautotrophica]AVX30300.1 oligopeptide transport system substrate-binding protein [Carboxydocella thermautotrophica]SJZ51408.1 oligopeptide transport system substrate-binding protein [Carboxydocella sporoproducens DSM 16521]